MKRISALAIALTCSASVAVAAPSYAQENSPQITAERCVELRDNVSKATSAHSSAAEERKQSQSAVDAAQKRVTSAEDALNNVKDLISSSEKALTAAQNSVPEKESNLERQTAARASTQKELKKAQDLEASASQKLAPAKASLATAQAELQESKTVAQTQFNRGSLGFFEKMGSQEAIAELSTNYRFSQQDPVTGRSNYRIAGDTRIGAQGDATHLDNMKAAIEWLPEANRLRQSDGQPALPVSDFLMAQAQVNINWSHQLPRGHSGNGLDNLAWNGKDPFERWFHKERKVYFDAIASGKDPFSAGAGHYMAIVNPDYVATGFAINTESYSYNGFPWDIAYAQTFGVSWEDQGKTYSVEDYTARFNNYYNGLKDAIKNGGAEERAAVSALEQEFEKNQAALETATAAREQAEAADEAAAAAVTAAERELADAKALVERRKAELQTAQAKQAQRQAEAEAELAAANDAKADAEARLAEAITAEEAANSALTDAQGVFAPVKAQCDALVKPAGSSEDGSSTGAIIGGVIAAIIAIAVAIFALNPQILASLGL